MKIVIMVCRIMLLVIITGTYNICHSQYNATTSDMDKNWMVAKTLNTTEGVKSISKQYFDNSGNGTQVQLKNMTTGQIMAVQAINDARGRLGIITMPGAINSVNFLYKSNFVLNPSGTNYTYQNFDEAKTNSPDPIGGQNTPGTLGWYYSDNNSLEARQATSNYPYIRTDYCNDGTGSEKRAAVVGDAYRMGQGREESGYISSVANELGHYYQVRNQYYTSAELGNMSLNYFNNCKLLSSKDVNGKESISIVDEKGLELMTAIPGNDITITNNITLNGLIHQVVMPTVPTGNGCALGNQTVYITGTGRQFVLTNPSAFQITIPGPLYGYPVPFYSGTDWGTNIKSDESFSVQYYDRQGVECSYVSTILKSQQIASGQISVYYFKIFADNTPVTIGGTYTLYDMATEQVTSLVGGAILNKGYYKLLANSGVVTMTYTNSYGDISYNFYNQMGQLVSTVAPEGVKKLIQNLNAYPTKADVPFISNMEYDTRGRLIAADVPDGGRAEFIYRKDGNLRFSQNPQQQTQGWFSYTNYDNVGRPIESGEYRPNGDITFASLKTNTSILEDVSPTGGLPNASNQYDWIKSKYDVTDNSYSGGVTGTYEQTFVRGAISMTEGLQSKTWYSYDFEGKPVWVIKWINGLGYKTTDYVFDAEGRLTSTVFQKNIQSETFVHLYEYDADDRLSKVYTKTNNNSFDATLQAHYIYYENGSVKRLEIGGNLQGIDYTYTLDGKLKGINHSVLTNDPGNDGPSTNGFLQDVFGEMLDYYPGDYVRSNTNFTSTSINPTFAPEEYNGQIRGMNWFSKKPIGATVSNDPTTYVYKYDDMYRFQEATWGTVSGNSFVPQPGINKESVNGYDFHGNIQNLTRTNSSGVTTDNFLYNYVQSPKPADKLSSITQQTTNQTYATYQYDNLGQLTAEIPGPAYGTAPPKYIKYDVSGKVVAVYNNPAMNPSSQLVSFVYDELGQRIKKESYNSGTLQKTTFYVYDGVGELMSTYDQPAGGNIVQSEVPFGFGDRIGVYFRQSDAYRYEMADHLGNVRAVFLRISSGNISMVVFKDYYPFGMGIPGRSQTDADGYRYEYQGQNAEKDPETEWNAFELRMYDSRTARWLSTDPMGEFWSPYASGNDPINRTDPTGGCEGPDCPTGWMALEKLLEEVKVGGFFDYTRSNFEVILDNPKSGSPDQIREYFYKKGLAGSDAMGRFEEAVNGMQYRKNLAEIERRWRNFVQGLLKEVVITIAGGYVLRGSSILLRWGLNQSVNLAGRFTLNQAIDNPIFLRWLERVPANFRNGILMDRSFRFYAQRNFVFKALQKMNLIKFTRIGRFGADIEGRGFLNGLQWDVTSNSVKSMESHVAKYGNVTFFLY